ncbi:MAG: site-specific integrase [Rhodospirillaceae bacterium]|nr:site-specific integrase [Rhodospirillaceae bacterium]
MAESTLKDYRKQARRYLLPAFGQRRVVDLCRADVERLASSMVETPSQRNRTLALASRLFTLAEHWEWRSQHTNPVRGVMRAREEARDRTLSGAELASIGEALESLAGTYPAPVAAIRLCAMSGMRIGEALAIRWQDIDFEAGRVTLPKTKAGRQVRAIPRVAVAMLASLPRVNGSEWAFSGTRRAAVGYRHARDVFAKACERAGVEGVTLHDLRRTVATNAAASGVGLTVLRDVLGHRTTAMASRYARMADSAVAAAVEATGGAIAGAMGVSAPVADLEAERARRRG